MAMDQAMLEQTAHDGDVRLRFYRWSNPTVSLGYFQKYSDYLDFCRPATASGQNASIGLRPLDVVRRATGGGAIVHHYDWTYSISIPSCWDEEKKTMGASCGLYSRVHESVVGWLNRQTVQFSFNRDAEQRWALSSLLSRLAKSPIFAPQSARAATKLPSLNGIGLNRQTELDKGMGQSACRWPIADKDSSKGGCAANRDFESDEKFHFLCFMRRSVGDIVIGPHKVMGSAQRRYQSAILQHGSLLLATSPYAPELVGLREFNGQPPAMEDNGDQLLKDFAQTLVEHLAECYHFRPKLWDKDQPFANVSQDSRKRLESRSWTARM